MSEPAPAQVEAPVPQDSATSVAAEPAAEGGAEGQSKKGAKKVRARSVNLEAPGHHYSNLRKRTEGGDVPFGIVHLCDGVGDELEAHAEEVGIHEFLDALAE